MGFSGEFQCSSFLTLKCQIKDNNRLLAALLQNQQQSDFSRSSAVHTGKQAAEEFFEKPSCERERFESEPAEG